MTHAATRGQIDMGLSWKEVNKSQPCPICGKADWCSASSDGVWVTCRRVDTGTGKPRTDKAGTDFWLYRVIDGLNNRQEPDYRPVEPAAPAADPDTLNKVYRFLLRELRLDGQHKANLAARGLSEQQIEDRDYKTMPLYGRAKIAKKLAREFTEDICAKVPGLYLKEDGTGRWWSLAGAPGTVIPIRDHVGRVVALKIRRDEPGDGPKYLYLSSNKYGGPGPGSPVHVPTFTGSTDVIRITEGELKADIATILTGTLCISIPGVSTWRPALAVLKAVGAKIVRVAFDSDAWKNRNVSRALKNTVAALIREGFLVELEQWPEESGKGIDDLLVAGGAPQVLAGEEMEHAIQGMVDASRGVTETDQGAGPQKTKRSGKTANVKPFFLDENGSFMPTVLGDHLMAKDNFLYAGQTLYAYKDGAYRPGGENVIRLACKSALESCFRKNRVIETIYYVETSTLRRLDELNNRPGVINLKNGLYDLKTGELLPHDPSFLTTIQLPVNYDPGASCPAILKFFSEVVPGDCLPLLEELFGYCMIPVTFFEKAFMLTGSQGANGKSTLINLLTKFVGPENVSNVPLQELIEHKFKRAQLLGKLVNTFADLENSMLKGSAYFKAVVTGDEIDAERKFKDPFNFRPFAKLIFSANELPRSPDRTNAYYRRWVIIPFENTFTGAQADKQLIDKLTTPEELSGLLNCALAGLRRLGQNRVFTEPESVKRALEGYKIQNDPVSNFVDEACIIGVEKKARKAQLYEKYTDWCFGSGIKRLSSIKFNHRLLEIVPGLTEIRPDGGIRLWKGIGVAES